MLYGVAGLTYDYCLLFFILFENFCITSPTHSESQSLIKACSIFFVCEQYILKKVSNGVNMPSEHFVLHVELYTLGPVPTCSNTLYIEKTLDFIQKK